MIPDGAQLHILPHGGQHGPRVTQRARAGLAQLEVPASPPAALGRWFPHPRADVALPLEAVEGGVYRSDRHGTPGPILDLAPDGHPVALLAQPGDGQENELLELAKKGLVSHGGILYIVVEMGKWKFRVRS